MLPKRKNLHTLDYIFWIWVHLKMSQKVFFKGEKLSARGILRARSVKVLTLLALKKPLEHPKILL
ncbi:MAG: hypothetical protein AAF847_20080, partial [Bacteroidota bacterium]